MMEDETGQWMIYFQAAAKVTRTWGCWLILSTSWKGFEEEFEAALIFTFCF